jgi:hypothetical protein
MTIYEYRCDRCGDDYMLNVAWDSPVKQQWDDGVFVHFDSPLFNQESFDPCGGTYKRKFGFRISRYSVTEHAGTADERTFTTESSYARYLKSQSQHATDRTGIPHDFVPVDLMDESVRPADHERILREAQLAHGADKKIAPLVVPSTAPSSD